MIEVIWGTTTKPVAAGQLAEALHRTEFNGTLYFGFPVIATPDGPFSFDAVLLSPTKGLVAFDIVEGKTLGDFTKRQDECYNRLNAKLLHYPTLMAKRRLQVVITVLTFAPAVTITEESARDSSIATESNLSETLQEVSWETPGVYPSLVSAIQAISSIRKVRRRTAPLKPNSRGSRLCALEDSIANLDIHQSAAVVETVEGVQRIRGLAGSGKTIVLARKVAYLHTQHPDWMIGVTFNTRALKGQLERFITTFVIEQTNQQPDWNQIRVLNAWGAPGSREKEGVYYKYCAENGLRYLDFSKAKELYGNARAFEGACQDALKECVSPKPFFDLILIDEAQDLSQYFLRLCYESVREPKRLVYAYDELQSLTDNSLPAPEELFGKNSNGSPNVAFDADQFRRARQDIVLRTCYRNSRPVLVTAHGIGFGIHRTSKGLVQLFDQSSLWNDVGYDVIDGELRDGNFVSLGRSKDSSPPFLEEHSPVEDLIMFKIFDSEEEQTAWLVEEIATNINEDELQPEDILVINPDPIKTRDAVSTARAELFGKGINSNLAGVSSSPDIFFKSGNVTFTGIFRAKGNEAGMVYVINAQDCYFSKMPSISALLRNQLFTAITRSKAWVRVVGHGSDMEKLVQEYEKIKKDNYCLNFVYPTGAERSTLKAINRDTSEHRKRRGGHRSGKVQEFIAEVKRGDRALDEEERDALLRLLEETRFQ